MEFFGSQYVFVRFGMLGVWYCCIKFCSKQAVSVCLFVHL